MLTPKITTITSNIVGTAAAPNNYSYYIMNSDYINTYGGAVVMFPYKLLTTFFTKVALNNLDD